MFFERFRKPKPKLTGLENTEPVDKKFAKQKAEVLHSTNWNSVELEGKEKDARLKSAFEVWKSNPELYVEVDP
jgi:hypothetical protein